MKTLVLSGMLLASAAIFAAPALACETGGNQCDTDRFGMLIGADIAALTISDIRTAADILVPENGTGFTSSNAGQSTDGALNVFAFGNTGGCVEACDEEGAGFSGTLNQHGWGNSEAYTEGNGPTAALAIGQSEFGVAVLGRTFKETPVTGE